MTLDDTFRRLDALLAVALRIARSAPSGQIGLARGARAIELEWIPPAWGPELIAELRTAGEMTAEPLELRRVERILRDAWGTRPSDELDELDPEPVAVTPGAQVHRGLLDGDPVAVKVLRPGLAASVRRDLGLLESLAAPLRTAFPALDPRALLREVRERVLEELDLEHEAAVQRQFHRALRRHPALSVPAPVMRLAHDNVLVSEWVDGTPLPEAPDHDQAAARLVLFALGAARFGVVHADLKPDDVLVLDGGRLAILDFGATRTVRHDRVQSALDALEAAAVADSDTLGRALAALGALPADRAPVALSLTRHALGPHLEAASRVDGAAVVAARDRLLHRPEELAELILTATLAPEDLWPARGTAQLFATIARVGASGDWVALARAALRDGWEGEVAV